MASEEEFKSLTDHVSDKMFEADRYSQDPIWTRELSSKRYVNWINEQFESGIQSFIL